MATGLAAWRAQGLDGGLGGLQAGGDDVLGRSGRTAGDQGDSAGGGLGLHHHDRNITGGRAVGTVQDAAGNHHVEGGPLQLGMGREGHPGAVDVAHPGGADRAGERQSGQHGRGAGRVDRDHVVQRVRVEGQDGADHLDLVAQPFGERRPQRAVDQPAGEDRVLGRAAFAAEERAGNATGGVHPLFHVDGEREEIQLLFRVLGRGGGGQHHGVAQVGDGSTRGLAGQPTGLEPDLAGAGGTVVDRGGGGNGSGKFVRVRQGRLL